MSDDGKDHLAGLGSERTKLGTRHIGLVDALLDDLAGPRQRQAAAGMRRDQPAGRRIAVCRRGGRMSPQSDVDRHRSTPLLGLPVPMLKWALM